MALWKIMMERIELPLDGLVLLRPRIFNDARGHFLETFNERSFRQLTGTSAAFVQDNESSSAKGVLRGLHFQVDPHAQGKLVRVIHGAVLDVCLDIRPNSATYGQHFKIALNGTSKELLWIPAGFAHGFTALEPDTVFAYKCTNYYHPPAERTILWNDPELGIDWGVEQPIVSDKDQQGMAFRSHLRNA